MNKQTLIAIACMQADRGIAKDNTLPWHIPEELEFFKDETMGYPVIMGRVTWESLPSKRLKGRLLIVLSSDTTQEARDDVVFVTKMSRALELASIYNLKNDNKKVYIAGGAKVYKTYLPICDKLILTQLSENVVTDPDHYFPEVDEDTWKNTLSVGVSNPVSNFEIKYYHNTTK